MRQLITFIVYPFMQSGFNWLATMVDPFNRHAFYHFLNFYLPWDNAKSDRPDMICDFDKLGHLPYNY